MTTIGATLLPKLAPQAPSDSKANSNTTDAATPSNSNAAPLPKLSAPPDAALRSNSDYQQSVKTLAQSKNFDELAGKDGTISMQDVDNYHGTNPDLKKVCDYLKKHPEVFNTMDCAAANLTDRTGRHTASKDGFIGKADITALSKLGFIKAPPKLSAPPDAALRSNPDYQHAVRTLAQSKNFDELAGSDGTISMDDVKNYKGKNSDLQKTCDYLKKYPKVFDTMDCATANLTDRTGHSTSPQDGHVSKNDIKALSNLGYIDAASKAKPGSAEDMEQQLRDAGLLTGGMTDLYQQWLENAAGRGVSTQEILKIAREHGITPKDFAVLKNLPVYHDPDGKSFFQLPPNISGEDARKAVLMTYIFNAGTDYGAADKPANSQYDQTPSRNDFQETPYSSAEISRIEARQAANSWSYDQDVAFVSGNGGRLVTTPNGMLMGLGGNRLQGLYSQQGGTTWGDIFMVNIDKPTDPQTVLKNIVEGGSAPITQDTNGATNHWLDLDRLLHHEEKHSEQWASKGYGGFLAWYGWDWVMHHGMTVEKEAGLHDGGYQ